MWGYSDAERFYEDLTSLKQIGKLQKSKQKMPRCYKNLHELLVCDCVRKYLFFFCFYDTVRIIKKNVGAITGFLLVLRPTICKNSICTFMKTNKAGRMFSRLWGETLLHSRDVSMEHWWTWMSYRMCVFDQDFCQAVVQSFLQKWAYSWSRLFDTQCWLKNKWLYCAYPHIPSTTPLPRGTFNCAS